MTAQAAAMPPFEPDQSARGCLNFYDAQGNVQSTGSITDSPMVAFAQAAGPARSGGGGGADNTGTLYGYLAIPGTAPAEWPGEQLSSGNSFPAASEPASLAANKKNPTYVAAPGEESVGTLQANYPHPKGDAADYQGVYQIRFVTSGAASGTDPLYWRADVQIAGKTWTQIWCTPLAQNAAGGATNTSGSSATQTGGASGSATSTVSPSGSAGGTGGTASGAGKNGSQSGSGSATSTSGSAAAQRGKGAKGSGSGSTILIVVLLAAIVLAAVLLWLRSRRGNQEIPPPI